MKLSTDALLERFGEIPGVQISAGAFSAGDAIWVGRREVAHFDSDGALDVRLTKAVIRARRKELESDPRVTLRPSASDWIEVIVAASADVDFAVALVRDAVEANRSSAPPGPAPTGADLERRRRFH